MKITVLGTGTSVGVPIPGCKCATCTSESSKDKRLRCSIIIQVPNKDSTINIVVDTGPDFRQQMLRADVEKLDAVLFTHSHADHIMGLDDLRSYNFVSKSAVDIYCTDECLESIKKTFWYIFNPDPNYQGGPLAKIKTNQIHANTIFNVSDLKITPLSLKHGRMDVLGFKIGNFAYCTDCNFIPEETYEELKNIDVIILDGLRHRPHMTHFTFDGALQALDKIQPKKAYLTHISHDSLHEETNQYLKENSSIDVELAYDNLEILL